MKKFRMTITKWIVFMAMIATIETAYFGWNWKPESKAELACDIAIVSTAWVGAAKLGLRDAKEEREKDE